MVGFGGPAAHIINALWKLGKKAIKSWQLVIIGLMVMGLVVWEVNEIIALLLGGIIGMFWLGRFSGTLFSSGMIFLLNTNPSTPPDSPKLWQLGLFFLKKCFIWQWLRFSSFSGRRISE